MRDEVYNEYIKKLRPIIKDCWVDKAVAEKETETDPKKKKYDKFFLPFAKSNYYFDKQKLFSHEKDYIEILKMIPRLNRSNRKQYISCIINT